MTFSTIALLLASVGIYGVFSCSIEERTTEIGIRAAGRRGVESVRLVLGSGLTLAVVGLVAGARGAYFLSGAMQALLFGVPVDDPVTMTSAAAAIVIVALLACLVPARRATRVDPIVTLRRE